MGERAGLVRAGLSERVAAILTLREAGATFVRVGDDGIAAAFTPNVQLPPDLTGLDAVGDEEDDLYRSAD